MLQINGTSVSFPMRLAQKVVLRFAEESELPALLGDRMQRQVVPPPDKNAAKVKK